MPAVSGPSPRQGRPRDPRSHDAILRAVLDLLSAVGYQSLTIGAVAKQAGVGKATIYRWWPSKLDLILEAVAPRLEIGLAPNTGNTRHDLRIGAERAISSYSQPLVKEIVLAVMGGLEEDPRLRTIYHDRWALPWRASMAEVLERGIADGDLDPALDVELMIDVLTGTILQRVVIVPEPHIDGLAQHLVDLTFGHDSP